MKNKNITLLILAFFNILFFSFVSNACDDINVHNAWAKPTLGNSKIGAVYLYIINKGDKTKYLESAETDKSQITEIHKTVSEKGVSTMIKVDKLAIPEKSTIEMKPGGLHIMLMKLNEALKTGDKFKIILNFSDNCHVEQEVTVKTISGQ
jgi:periplasmic copper chaperone A